MKKLIIVLTLLSVAATAYAIPVMQVGVPDGSGGYVINTSSSSNPTETNTAITFGSTIAVAAQYSQVASNDVISIGGQYTDGFLTGPDWGSFGRTIFNTHEAVLLASVADGKGSSAFSLLTVNGMNAFAWDEAVSYFGDNHDPLKDNVSDFLFFDIGTFSNTAGVVPNFQDPSATLTDGEVKTLTIAGMGDLDWIHFDVMALLSYYDVTNGSPSVRTVIIDASYGDNPGSKDVTWKKDDDGGGGGGTPVPEPSTFILLGAGLAGLAFYRRKKS